MLDYVSKFSLKTEIFKNKHFSIQNSQADLNGNPPETVSLRYVRACAVLTCCFQQTPCHTRHTRALEDRACADVSSVMPRY